MYTAFVSPTHFLPVEKAMPTDKDPLGGGAMQFRRKQTRALRRWEITAPGHQEKLDSIDGLLEFIQGDTPVWFDGAGMLEVIEPIIIGIGTGSQTQFMLPHRHVYVASAIIYVNNAATAAWTPLGDGVTMDSLTMTAAPALNAQITAEYKRKAKVVLDTEASVVMERSFRSQTPAKSVNRLRYFLTEVAS